MDASRKPSSSPRTAALLYADFAEHAAGPYRAHQLLRDFPGARITDGVDQGRVQVVPSRHEVQGHTEPGATTPNPSALRVCYPRGAVGPRAGGAQWHFRLASGYDQLFCAYRLRFAPGFDFVRGGKLPGLAGGAGNTGGNKPNGRDGFSARMMWREKGVVVQYLYHPDQPGIWGEDLPWALGGERRFVPGVWHSVEHQLVLNTPGRHDGRVRGWFDGELALERGELRFRETPELRIDQFYFSTFFGGNERDWAPRRDEFVDFTEIRVATAGSAGAGR